jgi:hypothetical protein
MQVYKTLFAERAIDAATILYALDDAVREL